MAVTATQSKSIEGAIRYFNEGLCQGDYYVAGRSVEATWHGQLATALGIEEGSRVTATAFKRLLAGFHPLTGKKLVQRLRKDRRPGLDLTFSTPKSVSAAWAILEDQEIKDVLREAVAETMVDVERLMCRRVRDGRHVHTQHRRPTGKIIWADFLHTTSRPVDGKPDPHLHIHAYIPNLTIDGGALYAAEPEEIFRHRPALQAKFEARLARKLQARLGYRVTGTTFTQSGKLKRGWEIAGIEDRHLLAKFSRRTEQIEAFAKEHGIKDAARKSKLGAKVRDRKTRGLTADKLHREWQQRLTPNERHAFDALRAGDIGSGEGADVAASLRYSLSHHLERQSTMERHVIVATALEHGVTLAPEEVEAALDVSDVIQRSKPVRGAERHFVTTKEVLDAERTMIDFARDGRGRCKPLGQGEYAFRREWLGDGQKAAVNHVLNSGDTVIAITGGAGTGKSSLMAEVREALEERDKKIWALGPSTGSVEVLQEKGFEARTVEHLIRNERLHPQLKDQVLWVDEAGLVDVRSMNAIFQIAKTQSCRVVLSGDPRQHSSPSRGEAMRMLEKEAGLSVARVQEVQRQKGKYKRAVELVSLGHQIIDKRTGLTGILAGFDLLDKLGRIKEIKGEDRHQVLAKRYVKARNRGKDVLVISPTHAEKDAVTDHIRSELRKEGAIGGEDRVVVRLKAMNWTLAQKGEVDSYAEEGTVVQFHQNAKGGFKRGERYHVSHDRSGTPTLRPTTGGRPKPLPLGAADRFEVYREEGIELAQGDKVRFTLGGKTVDKASAISNGRLDTVERFDRSGHLVLKSGMVVSRDYGHIDRGYVVSSHASQGKDRSIAMAAIGSESLPAVNAKQFYVSVSRGRDDVLIYVDDKQAVRRAISDAGNQLSATELMQTQLERSMRAQRDRNHRIFVERMQAWWRDHVTPRRGQANRRPQPRGWSAPRLGRT